MFDEQKFGDRRYAEDLTLYAHGPSHRSQSGKFVQAIKF